MIEKFGDRLREVRLAAGMSHERFAQTIGQGRRTVMKWEVGETQPTITPLVQIRRIFGTDLNWLIDGVPAAPSNNPTNWGRYDEIWRTVCQFCEQAGFEPSDASKHELTRIWFDNDRKVRGADRKSLRRIVFDMALERHG